MVDYRNCVIDGGIPRTYGCTKQYASFPFFVCLSMLSSLFVCFVVCGLFLCFVFVLDGAFSFYWMRLFGLLWC